MPSLLPLESDGLSPSDLEAHLSRTLQAQHLARFVRLCDFHAQFLDDVTDLRHLLGVRDRQLAAENDQRTWGETINEVFTIPARQ